MSITVKAVKCPKCGETIYSRCHYDFHYCHCGATAIDGGFDYVKISGKDAEKLQAFDVKLDDVDEEGLHKDWSEETNKYGWIPNAESTKEEPGALACSPFPTLDELKELDRIGLRGVMDKIAAEYAPTNFDKWASEITPQSLTDQNGMPFFDCEICPACIPMKCDCRDPEKCKKNWAEWCARKAE